MNMEHYKKLENLFFSWLFNWLDIFDSLVYILSFTFLDSNIGFKARCWNIKRGIKYRNKKKLDKSQKV